MSSLKQKIQKEIERLKEKQKGSLYGGVGYEIYGRLGVLEWTLRQLDVVTKQIREDSFDTFVPIGEDEQEIVVVIKLKDVLAVLEGAERE